MFRCIISWVLTQRSLLGVAVILKVYFFKLTIQNSSSGTRHEISCSWISQNLTNIKSALVLIMAWYRQATSQYQRQYCNRSMLLYGITRRQWVKHQALFHISHWYYCQNINTTVTRNTHMMILKLCYLGKLKIVNSNNTITTDVVIDRINGIDQKWDRIITILHMELKGFEYLHDLNISKL